MDKTLKISSVPLETVSRYQRSDPKVDAPGGMAEVSKHTYSLEEQARVASSF
jgi:hypothetical protein